MPILCIRKRAFGLIEVLIVVTIFLLCLTAVISATTLSYKNLQKNELRWKAMTLGQNAIDQARNQRDSNILQNLDWKSGLYNSGTANNFYYDYNMNLCPSQVCASGLPYTFTVAVTGTYYPPAQTFAIVYSVQVSAPGITTFTYKTMLKDYASLAI